MIRKSSFNDPKKRRAKGIKNTDVFTPKRSEFNQKLAEAMRDNRLISKKSEKHDKWGIAIDPSPLALTWKRLYLILIIIGAIIASIGYTAQQKIMMIIGIIIGMSWLVIAIKQGKAKMDAEKNIYDTIFSVLKGHLGTSDPNAQPRDIIHIDQWTTPDEPQLIADGRTKSSEDGEAEEFEKDVPKPDKRGKIHQPKIAEFRTTPLSMKVDFPPTFREAGTDDTLQHLNEAFGHVTEWVAERDVPDEKHTGQMKTISGWDFPGHTAYLRTVPPLPTMAKLPVDFDKGPWNQIKLGRTVSGEAYWDLKVTPMALVPLAIDTLIWKKTGIDQYTSVRLDTIKPGDTLLTEIGTDTTVLNTTPVHTPESMFRIVFIDDNHASRRLQTVKAAGEHNWIMNDGSECTSQQLYDAVKRGERPILAPVYGDNRIIHWRVYSIAFMPPEPVMCVNVDDSTHTFLIATRNSIISTNSKTVNNPSNATNANTASTAKSSNDNASTASTNADDNNALTTSSNAASQVDNSSTVSTTDTVVSSQLDNTFTTSTSMLDSLTTIDIGNGYSELIINDQVNASTTVSNTAYNQVQVSNNASNAANNELTTRAASSDDTVNTIVSITSNTVNDADSLVNAVSSSVNTANVNNAGINSKADDTTSDSLAITESANKHSNDDASSVDNATHASATASADDVNTANNNDDSSINTVASDVSNVNHNVNNNAGTATNIADRAVNSNVNNNVNTAVSTANNNANTATDTVSPNDNSDSDTVNSASNNTGADAGIADNAINTIAGDAASTANNNANNATGTAANTIASADNVSTVSTTDDTTSMMITVDRDTACAHGIPTHNCGSTGGGKSVLQRLAVFHCIAHSNDIKFLGIDLKMVELSPYTVFSDTVLGIAITLEDAVEILKFGNDQMMSRYNQMQKAGVNNFADLPNHGPAILIMVDECGQLLDMSGGKGTDEAKAESALKGQAQSIIGSIARLGRAAGVHLLLATQRPDAKLIPGELKENLMFRAGCGHLTSTASSMLFDDATGTQTPASPKGRAAVMNVGQKPQKIQVYFTKDYSWMVDWLKNKGLNPDLTPLSTGPTVGGAAGVSELAGMTLDNNSADIDAIASQRDAIAQAHAKAVQEQSDSESAPSVSASDSSGFVKPVLKGQQNTDKHDPRDDWDDDMDELID